jgi:hypothetical protein
MKVVYALVMAALSVAITVQGASAELIILGNLPPANDNFGAFIDAGIDDMGSNFINVRRAVSFTVPSQSYPVDHVTLRLRAYVTTAGDIAAVGFYEDNGMDLPGALVGSLLVSPPSASDATGQFDFTPAGPLTLAASTKYWLLVDASAGEYENTNGKDRLRASCPPRRSEPSSSRKSRCMATRRMIEGSMKS